MLDTWSFPKGAFLGPLCLMLSSKPRWPWWFPLGMCRYRPSTFPLGTPRCQAPRQGTLWACLSAELFSPMCAQREPSCASSLSVECQRKGMFIYHVFPLAKKRYAQDLPLHKKKFKVVPTRSPYPFIYLFFDLVLLYVMKILKVSFSHSASPD